MACCVLQHHAIPAKKHSGVLLLAHLNLHLLRRLSSVPSLPVLTVGEQKHTPNKHTHTQHTKYKTIPHTTKRTTAINTRPQRSEKKPWPHHGDLTSTPRWPEVSGSSRSVPCPGAANQNRYTTRGGPVDGLWSQGERRERVHVHVGRFSR